MLVHALKQRHPTKHFMGYLGGNIVKDESDTINDATNRSTTDFRYNDLYNKRRSERVLQVIKASINSDSHLDTSNTQIHNTPSNRDISDLLADWTRHNKPNGNKSTAVSTEDLMFLRQSNQIAEELKRIRSKGSKVNHKLKYAKLEEKLAVKTTELQAQLESVMGEISEKDKIIQKLESENDKLQENFDIVCNYVDDNYHSNKNQNKYGHLKMSKAEAMKKFNDVILKYRLEIYKNRAKSMEAQLTQSMHQTNIMHGLEEYLCDLALRNVSLKTENVELKLRITALQNLFDDLERKYNTLPAKIESTFKDNKARLEKAFDKLYLLQQKSKRRSFLCK